MDPVSTIEKPASATAVPSPRARQSPWTGSLILLHPGPSLLVTACLVAAVGAAAHAPPSPWVTLRLVALMLPIQFAIGALNDVCDQELDREAGKAKPLVVGSVSPVAALVVALCGFALGVGMGATFPAPTLALAALAAAAGAAYDLGLKRGPFSWAPWWLGFATLPLLGWAAAGEPLLRLVEAVPPLALLLALGLQLANALPDITADRRQGSSGLGVLLGARWSRRLSLGFCAAAVAASVALAPLLGQAVWLVAAGGGPLLLGAGLTGLHPRIRPFPVLAAGAGVMAAVWLVALG